MEEWKDIKDFEGMYQVSNRGRVRGLDRLSFTGRRLKGALLKQVLSTTGYKRVCISKHSKQYTKYVHQLVSVAFLGHKPDGYNGLVVDHISNNRLDNNLSNIQLVTTRYNTSKDRSGGTSKYVGVRRKGSKWQSEIRINGKKKYLGRFKEEYTASIAYQTALAKL